MSDKAISDQLFGSRRATMSADVLIRVGTDLFPGKIIELDETNDQVKRIRFLSPSSETDGVAIDPVYAAGVLDPANLVTDHWMWPLDPNL